MRSFLMFILCSHVHNLHLVFSCSQCSFRVLMFTIFILCSYVHNVHLVFSCSQCPPRVLMFTMFISCFQYSKSSQYSKCFQYFKSTYFGTYVHYTTQTTLPEVWSTKSCLPGSLVFVCLYDLCSLCQQPHLNARQTL